MEMREGKPLSSHRTMVWVRQMGESQVGYQPSAQYKAMNNSQHRLSYWSGSGWRMGKHVDWEGHQWWWSQSGRTREQTCREFQKISKAKFCAVSPARVIRMQWNLHRVPSESCPISKWRIRKMRTVHRNWNLCMKLKSLTPCKRMGPDAPRGWYPYR